MGSEMCIRDRLERVSPATLLMAYATVFDARRGVWSSPIYFAAPNPSRYLPGINSSCIRAGTTAVVSAFQLYDTVQHSSIYKVAAVVCGTVVMRNSTYNNGDNINITHQQRVSVLYLQIVQQ